jgi:hypothetical protein
MTDFRALCAELIEELASETSLYPGHERGIVTRARAALAEQPVGPTRGEAVAVYTEVMAAHDCQTLGDMAEHFASAVLARWGTPAIKPPADGEVGELVSWLLSNAVQAADANQPRDAGMLTWAAQVVGDYTELLEQRHPAPIPVAERLPGPEDCDAEGRCWWGTPGSDVMEPNWVYRKTKHCRNWDTHWLPANALPVPAND